MSVEPTDECLIEKIMGVIMEHGDGGPGGMTMNLAETADALIANLSWALSFSPDLQTRRDFRVAGEFWGKELAKGIASAKDFNRENGLLAATQMGRIQ